MVFELVNLCIQKVCNSCTKFMLRFENLYLNLNCQFSNGRIARMSDTNCMNEKKDGYCWFCILSCCYFQIQVHSS